MYKDWIDRQTKPAVDAVLRVIGKQPDDQLIVAPAEQSGTDPWTPDPAVTPTPAKPKRRPFRRKRKNPRRGADSTAP